MAMNKAGKIPAFRERERERNFPIFEISDYVDFRSIVSRIYAGFTLVCIFEHHLSKGR